MWMLIWFIGWMFTCGVIFDPSDKSAKWLIPISLVYWPLLLGIWVNHQFSNVGGEH